MKLLLSILMLCFLFSCSNEEDKLLGIWQSDSEFYRATYKIEKKGTDVKGLLLYYNDDTTVYKYEGDKEHYLFTGLKQQDQIFVDATAGATKSVSAKNPIELKLINYDTLAVTTYVMNRSLKEFWIRKNSR